MKTDLIVPYTRQQRRKICQVRAKFVLVVLCNANYFFSYVVRLG